MLRPCLAAVAALAAAPLPAQSVDEIIAKNVAARGGMQKIKAVESVRMTGRMSLMQGLEVPVVLEMKRPNRMRMDIVVQGMTGSQAFDGKGGWQLMPFGGRKDAEPLGPEETKDAEEQADMDGPLVDYKAKGHTVELVGKEAVEGSDAYKLKVTLKNGDVRYFFLDAEHFLEIRGEGKRHVRGTETETESSIGDYKEVGGLMLPHAFEMGPKGSPQKQKLPVEKIELNVPIDDARFTMPARTEAPKESPQAKD
jgi:hypothetical protein